MLGSHASRATTRNYRALWLTTNEHLYARVLPMSIFTLALALFRPLSGLVLLFTLQIMPLLSLIIAADNQR